MRYRILLATLGLCFGLLVFLHPAKADTVDGITFTLVQANLTGNAGNTLAWEYSISNKSGHNIFGDHVDSSIFSGGTADATAFDLFAGGGFVIANQSNLTGTLFDFNSDPTVSHSFNSGVFDLFVDLAGGTQVKLMADYTATISPSTHVPEPGSLLLLVGGFLLATLLFRH